MGKYMKKAKIAADVAVMELPQSLLGVRTRAKTLALQRLQSSQPSPDSESCYLQLRSRRLEKHPTLLEERRKSSNGSAKRNCQKGTDSVTCRKLNLESISRFRVSSVHSSSVGSASINNSISNHDAGEGCFEILGQGCEAAAEGCDLGADASFGENNLDPEARDRSTRESTPCSLIREADTIKTPPSSTRQSNPNTTAQRVRSSVMRNMPSAAEVDEFFAYAEQQQQRLFAEKYNFDVVNDLPLPGRYDWVRVNQL